MDAVKIIKEEITGFGAEQVILFGSRADGTSDKYSDYDVLAVFDGTLSKKSELDIASKMRKRMAEYLIDADVIVRTSKEVEDSRNRIGSVVREAFIHGVQL